MAWSRVRIFNPYGIMLDEIDVPTVRSWVLDGVGRCQFTVPVFSADADGSRFNAKVTKVNFQFGNFILIDHKPSQNADNSFNGLLPPWVGMIVPPRQWSYGRLKVTALSAEQVLAFRPMPNYYQPGTPGGVYGSMLDYANRWGGIQLQRGNIDYGGRNYPLALKLSVLEHLRDYSKWTGNDWDITPAIGSNNQLVLQGNWYQKKGIETGLTMSNLNLQLADPLFSEDGTFYNEVYGSNDGTTNETRIAATSLNQTSIGESGPLVVKVVFPNSQGVAQDVMQSMTDNYMANLANNSTFVRTFAPTILDVDNAYSFCNTGNIWRVENDYVGFNDGGIGINGTFRITAMEYNDLTNVVRVTGALQ